MATIVILAASALVLLLALAGLRRVPAQRAATVRRFGRYRRTVGPGWHWLLPIDRTRQVDLINHHLHVSRGQDEAELYYQCLEPEKAGEVLERMDEFVAGQAQEASHARTTSEFKLDLNRRVAPKGLRVIRCALHVA